MITGRPNAKSLLVTLTTLLLITIATQFYWQAPAPWSDLLPAEKHLVFLDGQYWRVFTAILIHADIAHFLSNIYMLGIFGIFVYGYFGFTVFPVLSFLGAGLVNALAISTYPNEVRLLGASGLVYILGGLWLTLYFLIQRQYRVTGRLLRVVGIALMVFFPTTFVPTTSYRTHALGFAVGIILGLLYFMKNKTIIRNREGYVKVAHGAD